MRKLIPINQLTAVQMDFLRTDIEAKLLQTARQASPSVQDWAVREIFPWSDLRITSAGQASALTDWWGCTTLVANTLLGYVNNQLGQNIFLAFYGIAIRDVNPATTMVLMQTGGAASTKARWQLEELYASTQPIGVTPEYCMYSQGETVFVQLNCGPLGKAVGADAIADHIQLLGLVARPVGDILSV